MKIKQYLKGLYKAITNNTLESRINYLGEHYRGLWKSTDYKDGKFINQYNVTFSYGARILDTEYEESLEKALDKAIEDFDELTLKRKWK